VADGASEKSAGSAGWVKQALTRSGINTIDHERGYRARCVVLARVSGALQIVENLLVDVAEVLPLRKVVEVDLVDLVDDLPQQLAGLHVVVGVLEDLANHAAAVPLAGDGELLELRKELVIDETGQICPD
jgi:hypothetical protein